MQVTARLHAIVKSDAIGWFEVILHILEIGNCTTVSSRTGAFRKDAIIRLFKITDEQFENLLIK